jgi:hypothetical protein
MPSSRRVPAAAAALLLSALAASPARADLVGLRDGKVIEGKVSKSGGKITVKGWKGKSQTLAASEAKYVEEGECSWDAAARMAREIPADASDALYAEGHLKIARYLNERRKYCPEMEDLERKEYELVVKRVPDNEEARLGLGHRRWEKWWFASDKELEKFRKGEPPARMEPLGFVKYRKTGLWERPEDVEAMEAGKVRFKGRWMTEDEKKEAEGYVRDEAGGWVLRRDLEDRKRAAQIEEALKEKPVTVTSSRHFSFVSWLSLVETAKLKELAEKCYAEHRKLLGAPVPREEEAAGEDLFTQPLVVYALVSGERKNKWVEQFGKAYGWSDEVVNHRTEKGSGWHSLAPEPYLLSSGSRTEKNRGRDEDQDVHNARSTMTSQIGRILLDRVRGPSQAAWLMEGNALLAEIRANETADCCYVSMTKYREDVANKAGSKAKYFDFMREQSMAGLDRPLRQIFTLELNDLDWADSVKAWCFLEFLVENHLEEFRQLVRAPLPEVEEILPAHVEAAILAKKAKDPAAEAPGKKPKDEGPPPTAPIKVSGPGAQPVTEGSNEERAVRGAATEAWLQAALKKDILVLEGEWKAWLMKKR